MCIKLYTRIVIKEPDGKKTCRLAATKVANFEDMTDEQGDFLLDKIAKNALEKAPAGSVVTGKEFISGADFQSYINLMHTSGQQSEGVKHNAIYLKACGMFRDPENRYGFGPDGPDIPFHIFSDRTQAELTEQDKQELKKNILQICNSRFEETPERIEIITEEEYEKIIQAIKERNPDFSS